MTYKLIDQWVAGLTLCAAAAAFAQEPQPGQPPPHAGPQIPEQLFPLKITGMDCPVPVRYTSAALREEATGTTRARFMLDDNGAVAQVGIVRTAGATRAHKTLDFEVVAALRACKASVVPITVNRTQDIEFVWKLQGPFVPPPSTPSIALTLPASAPRLAPARLPSVYAYVPSLSTQGARAAEETLAKWLEHTLEFGVRPKRVMYRSSVEAPVDGRGGVLPVHLVEFEMPDGTYGRGFVNPVTWAFLGPLPYAQLRDVDLVRSYAGWLTLFRAQGNGLVKTEFEPQTFASVQAKLERSGYSGITITQKYKIGDNELFEYEGLLKQKRFKGAGGVVSTLTFDATAPIASLPVIYAYIAGTLDVRR